MRKMALLAAVALLIAGTPAVPVQATSAGMETGSIVLQAEGTEAQVRAFVERMYTVALGRGSDPHGMEDWTSQLMSHENDGAGIARGFLLSEEFTGKNLSNEDYVDTLYRTFFDREADAEGRQNWLNALAGGQSRTFVLAGFVNSAEFDNLCASFGIARGILFENGESANPGIRMFVERMYTKALNRQGEKAGVDDWTNRIVTGASTPEEVAKNFFASEEFLNRSLSNEDYVETLYQTFMDRASDQAGKADWVSRLTGGTSREEVLEGFSRSEEFEKILVEFGLTDFGGQDFDGENTTSEGQETIYLLSTVIRHSSFVGTYVSEQYEYNSAGDMIKYTSFDSQGYIFRNYEYEYDSAGNMTKEIWCNPDGSIRGYSEYEYDSAGNMTKEISCNSHGSIRGYSEYEYDDAGNMTKETHYDSDGSIYDYSEYEYDDADNMTKEISCNSDGSVYKYYEYEYDDAGNMTKETHYDSDGNVSYWYVYERTGTIYYNADGDIIVEWEYEYDVNGNMISETYYYPGEDEYEHYEYDYDSNGNRINKRGSTGILVEYEYDNAGNLIVERAPEIDDWTEYIYSTMIISK